MSATNRVALSYELTAAANVAEVKLTEELLAEVGLGEKLLARRLLGDLAYQSEALMKEALAECGVLLVTASARSRAPRGSR